VRLLLETELIRCTTSGNYQSESVTIPVRFFSREAEAVRNARPNDYLTIGCHLYGTEFKAPDGIVKRGVQIIADQILQEATHQEGAYQ